jgi:hypothetical protein
MASEKSTLLQSINIVTFLTTLTVNLLAGRTQLLGGKTGGDISNLYPTLITPAGYAFSIWSIIYALLLAFTIYQALRRNREQAFLPQISSLFALSGIWNVLWLFLWHYELIPFSVILMFALLATLIAIYLRLGIGRVAVPLKEKVFVHLPFSVYLGWITIASIANVAVALTFAGWTGGGIAPTTWATLVLVVALIITLIILITRKDVAYSLVVIWALGAILTKQMEYPTIMITTAAGITILLIAIAITAIIPRLSR